MNKITQLRAMLKSLEGQEGSERSVQIYSDLLEQELNKRKARQQARKLKQATTVANGITYISPLEQPDSAYLLEVKLFSSQVMKQLNIPGQVRFGTSRTSRAGYFSSWRDYGALFGSKSIHRAAEEGFIEYQQLKNMIRPYEVTGISGVRLLVLHELAHILTRHWAKARGLRVQHHGREYQQQYASLLEIFKSSLTLRSY